jgi:hypothetical protein
LPNIPSTKSPNLVHSYQEFPEENVRIKTPKGTSQNEVFSIGIFRKNIYTSLPGAIEISGGFSRNIIDTKVRKNEGDVLGFP